MRRKLMSFALACVMGTALLSGCSSASSKTTEQSSADKNAETDVKWPTRTIQVVVPFGAGGDTDIYARTACEYLQEVLGETMIVVNTAGASGVAGARQVLSADADGYTILFNHTAASFQEAIGACDFSFANDFALAGDIAVDNTFCLVIRSETGLKTMEEVINYLKENPEGLSVGTCYGGMDEYLVAQIENETGVVMKQLDVGSSASDRVAALIGGQVDLLPVNYVNIADYVTTGDLILLGTAGKERAATMQDVPTIMEQGINAQATKAYAFRFPKETDSAIVDKFTAAMKQVAENPEFAEKLAEYYTEPMYVSPEEQLKEELAEIEFMKTVVSQ